MRESMATVVQLTASIFVGGPERQMLGLAPICVIAGWLIWLMISRYESIQRLGGTWGIEAPYADGLFW